jgi:hypothetical protein
LSQIDKDSKILAEFINVYCSQKHKAQLKTRWEYNGNLKIDLGTEPPNLCEECSDLLRYSMTKRAYCPLNPKPTCKNCEVHCYADEYRSKIKEVMRLSGKQLILQGRLDLIFHYFF